MISKFEAVILEATDAASNLKRLGDNWTKASSGTPGDVAAGGALESIDAFNTAIRGLKDVMSIHAKWMMDIHTKIIDCVEAGIPKNYEQAIHTHKESVIWSVIKMDKHNYVCDLVEMESTINDSLSLLRREQLLDEDAEKTKQLQEQVRDAAQTLHIVRERCRHHP